MTAFYSDDALAEMFKAKQKWSARNSELRDIMLSRGYRTGSAREYASHGLARRLPALEHDCRRVFELIPPDSDQSPTSAAIQDATAFIQSFFANVYGAIDNMARIWCLEADLRTAKGKQIADGNIGFRPKNTDVRASLSSDFQSYLQSLDQWFEYLESYRHAIAHRIPVYIPSKTLSEQDAQKYKELEAQSEAAVKAGDKEEFWKLFQKQRELGIFQPLLMHSYGEGAQPITFHTQMIIDLATVVEIGEKACKELESLP